MSLLLWLERFSETSRKYFLIAVETMTPISMDCIQISKDSKLHTLLVSAPVNLAPRLDRVGDNECRPEILAVENAGTREMKSGVQSWEQTDIFLSNDDANGEDDC